MIDEKARDLIQFAERHPQGFTHQQACRALGIDHSRFRPALTRARALLREQEVNLPCEPEGWNEPWVYRLTGLYEHGRWWLSNRFKDGKTRMASMVSISHSMMLATDGRSLEGREARAIHRALSRLEEDLEEIRERELLNSR